MPDADRPPTPREDHAVWSWLAVEAELPESVQLQLLAALAAWQPILGSNLFSVEPPGAADGDVADLLEDQWQRRSLDADLADWRDRVALTEVAGRLALAIADLRIRRTRRWPDEGLE
jgi:hypothetical protein